MTEDNFTFHKTNKDNLQSKCNKCRNISSKIYRENNQEKVKSTRKKLYDQRRGTGICVKCNNKTLPNHSLCEEHWYRKTSLTNLGTTKYWKLIKELAENQNFRCIYTDELLIPAVNMSLDHIISRKDNPNLINDTNNVQWITKQMNQIKNELSHDNFIKLCKNISEKFK